jgi:hypothetical protein
MFMISDVKTTTEFSIIIQIITGLIGLLSVFFTVDAQHQILNDILTVELIVQIVELVFYIYFLRTLATTNITNMATVRYFDWVITTPIMLLTTIIYFKYEEEMTKKNPKPILFSQFLSDNAKNIGLITLLNMFMLLFGYLGETGFGDRLTMGGLGFVAFFGAFYIIHTEYATKTNIGKILFSVLFIVWSIYGVAYGFNDVTKNNLFNGLDLVAKNFFGIYLAAKIYLSRVNA